MAELAQANPWIWVALGLVLVAYVCLGACVWYWRQDQRSREAWQGRVTGTLERREPAKSVRVVAVRFKGERGEDLAGNEAGDVLVNIPEGQRRATMTTPFGNFVCHGQARDGSWTYRRVGQERRH